MKSLTEARAGAPRRVTNRVRQSSNEKITPSTVRTLKSRTYTLVKRCFKLFERSIRIGYKTINHSLEAKG